MIHAFMMVCKHFLTFFTWHTKASQHVLQHNRCTGYQSSNRSAICVSRKALIPWNSSAPSLPACTCLSGGLRRVSVFTIAEGAERPFVVTGTCVCWSMFVNEPEVCTLAFDLLRFNTISSWRISCKLWFMVLRPKLRTSSCAPRMKVDDILAA